MGNMLLPVAVGLDFDFASDRWIMLGPHRSPSRNAKSPNATISLSIQKTHRSGIEYARISGILLPFPSQTESSWLKQTGP